MTFFNNCATPCSGPVIRTLIGGLDESAQPGDGSYLALENIRTWILAQDLSVVPWNYIGTATFANDSNAEPDTVGGGALDYAGNAAISLANSGYFASSTSLPDSTIPAPDSLYAFVRIQALFVEPTNYLLVCEGNTVASEVTGCTGEFYLYDEGCAGVYGGVCGQIMEIPWSVIPGYPHVQIFLVGPSNGSTIWPNLDAAVAGFSDGGCSQGPDWDGGQTCGGPAHSNDPFGGQFEAP
jgi:hypothetical protein